MFTKRNKSALLLALILILTSVFPLGAMGQETKDYTINDARLALRAAVKIVILTHEQTEKLNVTGTGIVNIRDARLILRHSVGIIDEFPAVKQAESFAFPNESTFKFEMDALPKTDYKIGDTLEITTKLTNTSSQGYGIRWNYYFIKVWLEQVDGDPLPIITPMGLPYLAANETIENHIINGIAHYSESYTFTKAGTYKLTVSATFDVCEFTGTKDDWNNQMSKFISATEGIKTYSYTLPPVLIEVTK